MKPPYLLIIPLVRKRERLMALAFTAVLSMPAFYALGMKFPRFEVTAFMFALAALATGWGLFLRCHELQKEIDHLNDL